MARLGFSGFEVRDTIIDPFSNAALETTIVHSGSAAAKCDSGAGGTNIGTRLAFTNISAPPTTSYWLRSYVYVVDYPASTILFMNVDSGATQSGVKMDSTGHLLPVVSPTTGSASASVVPKNQWVRIEVKMTYTTGTPTRSIDEVRVDGVSYGISVSVGTPGATIVQPRLDVGWLEAPGANKVCYVDDSAINDSTGASQNTWPGEAKTALLVPTADSAGGTGWRLGTNTALGGNGFGSVDNKPPTGVADLAVGSDPKQIRNATANANDSFDATMTTYTAAGIAAGDTINVVVPVVATGAPVVTSAKAGTVGVVSNPAITNVALGAAGTAGAFWQGNTAGTYPTGWKQSFGTQTYSPSVTLSTAPVMRITQVTSSTRIAMVCFMGMYVDYTPAVVTQVPFTNPMPPLIAQ